MSEPALTVSTSSQSSTQIQVYILEDDLWLRNTLVDLLESACPGVFEITVFDSLALCLIEHVQNPCDVIISDLTVSDSGPSKVYRALKNQFLPDALCLVYSGDLAVLRCLEILPNLELYKKAVDFDKLLVRLKQIAMCTSSGC